MKWYFFLFILSLSFFLSQGYFGYGVDYYALYYKIFNYTNRIDFLGLLLLSINYNDFRLGIFIFIFLYLTVALRFIEIYFNPKILLIPFLVFVMSWPVIFNLLNVMRQGLLSIAILGGMMLYNKNRFYAFFLFLISGLLHRSGYIFLALFILTEIILRARLKEVFFFFVSVLSGISLFVLSKVIYGDVYTKTIGLNLNYFYLFLSALVWMKFIWYRRLLHYDFIEIYTVLSVFVFIFFWAAGQNWQYERLNMVLIMPILYLLSRYYPIRQINYFYISTLTLFSITLSRGMYGYFY